MLKKILKIVAAIIAVLVVLILTTLTLSLRVVDSTHFSKTDYCKSTVERMRHILNAAPQAAPAELHIGVGKAGITPPVGIPLAGYGGRKGAPSTGVHDSLFVRVVALESGGQQAYIVGYDALLLHPSVARRLEKKIKTKLNVSADRILYTATHTHSGPGGWGETWVDQQFAGPQDSIVATIFIDSTIAAVQRAILNRQPGSFSSSSIDAPRYIRNRLIGDEGLVDDDLVYAMFQRNNKPAGLFATYSAHATVMSERNMDMSGDYPGYFERAIESEFGSVAMFAAAGLGSHSYRGEGKGFVRAEFIGRGLADSVKAHYNTAQSHSDVALRAFRIPIDLAKMQIRLTQKICLAPWLAKKLMKPEQAYLQIIALNDFIIIGSPGEFSGELALRIKQAALEAGKNVTVTSFNGCYIGYVTPSEYYVMDEYETKLMSWFGGYTGDYLTDLMQQIVKNI
jgi:neutral ceramidase